jgi:CheY-like chemotaxis protein
VATVVPASLDPAPLLDLEQALPAANASVAVMATAQVIDRDCIPSVCWTGPFMRPFVYPRNVGSWKLLVVDDDPDIRRIAALSLGRIGGFRVALASCAEEAFAEVARERPDLVLLDVTMPGTDGPATLAGIHGMAGCETLPIIFFTATSSDTEVDRLRSLGAIGVVPKPFEVTDLPKRIRDLVIQVGIDWTHERAG